MRRSLALVYFYIIMSCKREHHHHCGRNLQRTDRGSTEKCGSVKCYEVISYSRFIAGCNIYNITVLRFPEPFKYIPAIKSFTSLWFLLPTANGVKSLRGKSTVEQIKSCWATGAGESNRIMAIWTHNIGPFECRRDCAHSLAWELHRLNRIG